MKAFFRFLRGEINGYYLTRIHNVNNTLSQPVKEFLSYFKKMQFKTHEELLPGEVAMNKTMAEGIGVTAGVFPTYILQDSLPASIKFTESHVVNGVERSERGLYNLEDEDFNFVHTAQDDYPDDINTRSTKNNRSSLVEDGRQPLGYFPEGETVVEQDGSLDMSKLLPAPRDGYADAPFYGENFMFLSESYPVLALTDAETMKLVIEVMQWIRYNGVNIGSLVRVAEIMCPNFLFIVSIDWDTFYAHGIVEFGIDADYEADKKLLKENIFKFLVEKKFPQLVLEEVSIEVTRDSEGNVITVEKV